ncbi:MAG: aminoglycoside phosphotransferase family protein [Nanoarchaeota archaeon]
MEQRIKEIIKREFDAEVFNIERITEGYSHSMFDVTIGLPLRNVIVRFANNGGETVNLAKEKYVIDLLRSRNIPAPKILAFHNEKRKGQEDYMILEKLLGTRLDTIWDELPKEEKIKLTLKVGALLARIHEIELEDFGAIAEGGKIMSEPEFEFKQAGKKPPYSKFIRQKLTDSFKDLARLISHKTFSPEFISKYMFYLVKNIEKIEYTGRPKLVHGDYVHGHLFVEKINGEYEIVGVIDFEFAFAYSPEYDFIKLHRTGFFDDPEIKKALEEGYGKINEEAVEIFRIMRDLGFAQVLYQSGDKELSAKVFKRIEEVIDRDLSG